MQGLYLFLTAVSVATAYVTYPSPATVNGIDCPIHAGCPAVDDPEFTVHLADTEDCHKYYKCVSGRGCLQLCPLYNGGLNRLVFNPELEVCDWPENVPQAHCNDKAPTAATTPTSTKPVSEPSEVSVVTEATPSNPGASTTKATEATSATKPTPSNPDTPTAKPTAATPATEPTPNSPVTSPTKPTAATPATEPTPNSPVTSPTNPTAATPATEPTPNSPVTSPTGPTGTPAEPGKCAAQGSLPVPHESDCRAYYNCHNGFRSEVQYCLEGNIFNPIQHTCDLKTNETVKYCPKSQASN